ncbi:MAG: chorismate synthase [Lachnospiraceae bacterium]|nr:chorismate synthase [Lachnospiraceae bacterium]
MAGSNYGKLFQITTWGESHGKALGVVIDGCPAGLPLSLEDIQVFLDRRKPGTSSISTPRKEADQVEILSGVFEGKTTGTPISLLVPNTSQISKDYSEIASYYRPGHADYTFDAKYGFRDYRGGGRSSGRETIGRVAAGAIALKILNQMGIQITTFTRSLGDVYMEDEQFDYDALGTTTTGIPNKELDLQALSYVQNKSKELDSVGGIMDCIITGMPAGVGEPVFDKLDADLAKAIMSIGAVKAIEIGDGVKVSSACGSENNDAFRCVNGQILKETNHAGGILGGISDGDQILLRAHVKPTPSIFKEQSTINKSGENIQVQIKGRHDPVIVPRALVVMESMVAITLLDHLMVSMSSQLSSLTDFYKK